MESSTASRPPKSRSKIPDVVPQLAPSTKVPTDLQFQLKNCFVVIKEEPLENLLNFIEGPSYCRCCFKVLKPTEAQYPSSEDVLHSFQDMTQLALKSHPQVMSFCGDCFDSIQSHQDFKQLAIAKQEKFNEKLSEVFWDFSKVHEIKLTSDPLLEPKVEFEDLFGSYELDEVPPDVETLICKSEPAEEPEQEEEADEKFEIPISAVSMDVGSADFFVFDPNVKLKKLLRHCKICKRKMLNEQRHLMNFHSIKCKWCGFKSLSKRQVNVHTRKKHGHLLPPVEVPKAIW